MTEKPPIESFCLKKFISDTRNVPSPYSLLLSIRFDGREILLCMSRKNPVTFIDFLQSDGKIYSVLGDFLENINFCEPGQCINLTTFCVSNKTDRNEEKTHTYTYNNLVSLIGDSDHVVVDMSELLIEPTFSVVKMDFQLSNLDYI